MFENFVKKLFEERYITLETTPTYSANINNLITKLENSGVVPYIDGFTTTDNPLAKLKYSSLFGAVKIQERFQKPVIATLSMRDRNKIALQSDLMGANDFGIQAILALTGDSAKASDQPNSKGVFEGDSTLLLDIINCFNRGINYAGKPFPKGEEPKHIYPFAVINSYSKNPKTLLKKMIKKIEHHSIGIITQPIYSLQQAEQLLELFEKAKKECNCDNPQTQLVFGFFPLTKFRTAQFLSAHVPGIYVPNEWLDRLQNGEEEKVGMEMSKKLFEQLMELHPKIHIMTANKFDIAYEILSSK